MSPLVYALQLLQSPVQPPEAGFQLLLALVSGGAFLTAAASIIVAVINERGRKKDAAEQRVLAASKSLQEGETVREANYRELAEQSRKNAETAVSVIERSLTATQSLADRLQIIVDSQNQTITQLTQGQVAQSDLIRAITQDRDRTVEALKKANAKVAEQQSELEQTRASLASATSELSLLDDLLQASRHTRTASVAVIDTTGPIPTVKETPDGEA